MSQEPLLRRQDSRTGAQRLQRHPQGHPKPFFKLQLTVTEGDNHSWVASTM